MAKHAAPTVPVATRAVLRPVVVSSAGAYLDRMRTPVPARAGRHARA